MPAPNLLTENGLDVKKGWFDMASLDYAAKLSTTVSFPVQRGRVVHVNSNGDFVPGAHKTCPAIFLLNGSEDADVSNPGTTASGNFMHLAVAPTGKMSGLVATGGYEISTTEFVTGNTYAPGDLLSATRSNATNPASTDGRLTNYSITQFTTPVVGVVSSGAGKNHNGIQALSFWCVYLPGASNWNGVQAASA
jgi:hypothetical protein